MLRRIAMLIMTGLLLVLTAGCGPLLAQKIQLNAEVEGLESGLPKLAQPLTGASRIRVTNKDSAPWTEVTFTLNKEYTYRLDRLESGKVAEIAYTEFAKADGTRFNLESIKPTTFTVRAKVDGKQGEFSGAWK